MDQLPFPLPNPPLTPYLIPMKNRNTIIFDKVAAEYERYRPGPDEAVLRHVHGLVVERTSKLSGINKETQSHVM